MSVSMITFSGRAEIVEDGVEQRGEASAIREARTHEKMAADLDMPENVSTLDESPASTQMGHEQDSSFH